MMRPPYLFAALLLSLLQPASAQPDLVQDWMNKPLKPQSSYNGPVIEAKFGHPAPPSSILTPMWQMGLRKLGEATNQKIVFKEYGGGTLLGAKDGFKAVRSGVAEWATCYVQFEGRSFPLSKVWEQPFIQPSNPMAATRIAFELAPKYFAREFERQQVLMAGIMLLRPTDLMSKKPVRRLEDLRGLKVIAQGFPSSAAAALGFTVVSIPYPEIYTALEQGLADAVLWYDAGFVPYRIYEVAKYHTALGLTGSAINMCANPAWYERLDRDLKKTFTFLMEPYSQAAVKTTQMDYSVHAIDSYRKNGVELITLPPAELQRIRDAVRPSVEKWASDLEKSGVPANALLADIKRLSDKYNGMSSEALMKLAIESPASPPTSK